MITIGEVARRVAEAIGEDEARVVRLLRGWLQSKRLEGTNRQAWRIGGAAAPAEFDAAGLARARILVAASAVGLTARLGVLDNALKIGLGVVTGERIESNPDLNRVVNDARKGSETAWDIEIAVARSAIGDSSEKVTTRWRRNGQPAFDDLWGEDWPSFEPEAFVIIPVSKIIQKLDWSDL